MITMIMITIIIIINIDYLSAIFVARFQLGEFGHQSDGALKPASFACLTRRFRAGNAASTHLHIHFKPSFSFSFFSRIGMWLGGGGGGGEGGGGGGWGTSQLN